MSKNRLPAEERRQLIIEKAAEVFAVRGVEGTRTRDIAEACGINEALLYRHFPSKDDLYRTAMLHAYKKALKCWVEQAENQPDGLEALIHVLKMQLTMLSENPVLCSCMWHGVASTTHDPEIKEQIRALFDKYQDFLRGLIRKGEADGSIREGLQENVIIWFLRGVIWVFMLNSLLGPDPGKVPEELKEVCDSFYQGMATHPTKDIFGLRDLILPSSPPEKHGQGK